MPKVDGIEKNDDEEDVAKRIMKVALNTTIYKEDIRISVIYDGPRAGMSPCKGGLLKKASPAKKPVFGAGKAKVGAPAKKPFGGVARPKGQGPATVEGSEIGTK